MLQRYAAFLGGATHEYIIGESLKRLFRRDKEFNQWLAKNEKDSPADSDARNIARGSTQTTSYAALGTSLISARRLPSVSWKWFIHSS